MLAWLDYVRFGVTLFSILDPFAAIPLFLGGSVLEVGYVSLDLPVLGDVALSSALLFDTGVYLAVVGMVLMVFEAFGDEPAGVST